MQNRGLLSVPDEIEQAEIYMLFERNTPHTVIMDRLHMSYTKVIAYKIAYEKQVKNEVRSKTQDNQK